MKILLLLPTLALATIDVQFTGKIDFRHSNMTGIFDATKYTNTEGRSLTDLDVIKTHVLNTEYLKDAAERLNSKRPDKIYLTCPGDEIDLCRENGWRELKKRIVPIEVTTVQVKTKQRLVTKRLYHNYDKNPKKKVIDVSEIVQNKLTSEWENANTSPSDNVHLNLNFRVNCGKVEIDKTFYWGKKQEERLADMLQEKDEDVIPPRAQVIAEMSANIGLVRLAVDYNVTLAGDVIAVYNDMYNGKRNHNLDIGVLLTAKGVSSSKIVTQKITYQFYYDSSLKIDRVRKQLSSNPIMTGSNDKHKVKDEETTPIVEGLGIIKMATADELKKYILKDIDDDMYLGLRENETREDKSDDSSEESEEN